jgi:hypothetical protein
VLAYGKLPIDMMEDGAITTPIGFEFAGTVRAFGHKNMDPEMPSSMSL